MLPQAISKVAAWGSLFIPNSPITYVGKAKEKPPETAAVGMWLITKVKKDGCALRTLLFGKETNWDDPDLRLQERIGIFQCCLNWPHKYLYWIVQRGKNS